MYGGTVAGCPEALDVTFRATRTVPGQVRNLVVSRLASWGLGGLGDDVELIASELLTNTVRHAPEREEIRVRFMREHDAVVLAVWDSSDVRPVRKRPLELKRDGVAPDAEALDTERGADMGGRGLVIVEALSESCGVTPTAPHGKWVWARCATAGPAADVPVHRVLASRS